jgi:hypothetical protein
VLGAVSADEVSDLLVVLGVGDRHCPGDPVFVAVPARDSGVGVAAEI